MVMTIFRLYQSSLGDDRALYKDVGKYPNCNVKILGISFYWTIVMA